MVASAMLSGDRRGVPTRRSGMTVLGKVTAPKPLNLPSQRLENRGLDPNVEIVPKGTVSWGGTGRSPPASGNAWGVASFSSSPPANAGPWSNRSNISTARPSSGGSATRPSTAGSDHSHDPATPYAWGSASSRPSSASGVLGLAHPQLPSTRPCSAESRSVNSQLSRFADSSVESSGPWGGSGTAQKMGENYPQHALFNGNLVDFPTLGSKKNPDLRHQQGNATIRSVSTSEGLVQKERSQSAQPDWCDDGSTGNPAVKDKRTGETWRRESPTYGGEMPAPEEEHPQKEGFHRQTYVRPNDSWSYADGHRNHPPSNLTEDEWRRGGPPVGPYGPPGGQSRFPFNPAGYMRPPPFEYGPVPYAQRPHGPGGYNRHGEVYGPFVAGHPGVPLGHSMYPSQLPFDGYYGPPVTGSHYGSMNEREMTMMRVGGGPGMYGGYPHNQGTPVDVPKFQHNGPGSGPRLASFRPSLSGEHNDPSTYGRTASEGTDKAFPNKADVWISKDAENSSEDNRPFLPQVSNTRKNSAYSTNNPQNDSNNPRPPGHRDWGTTSSDEQMDFSKPVFDEEALSNRVFPDRSSSGMESNHEKGGNLTRIREQRSLSDKKNIQVKIKDGGDSSEDMSQIKKRNSVEIDPIKVTDSNDHLQTGLENVQEEDVQYGEKGVSDQKIEAYSTSRNHALNTSLKLKGGLSSAAGLNTLSHETPKIRDKVQLLKRSDNHPMDNTMDTEEAVQQVHSTQGAKGIEEPLQGESHTHRGKFNPHEGDGEWRRKMPTAESASKVAKPNATTSAYVNRQEIAAALPDSDVTSSEGSGDKAAGESHAQQSAGPHDLEAQRARRREIAAQRAKQLQREEEERTKEQKAKALAKLEELDRRASMGAISQDLGNPKSEIMTSTLPIGSEVASEAVRRQQEDSYGNKSSVSRHIAADNLETLPSDNIAEVKRNGKDNNRVQQNIGEQSDMIKGGDSVSNKKSQCEVPPTQASVLPETPGNPGKNVGDTPVKSGKNEKGKRENSRRPTNMNKEEHKCPMRMDEQKSLLKERDNLPNSNSPRDAAVLQTPVAPLSTSEALQKDAPVIVSDSSRVADQLHQPDFPKQARIRQKTKQYFPEQKSTSCQPSPLEKSEQDISPDTRNSVKPAGWNDALQMSTNTTVDKVSETTTNSADGVSMSRKKKINKNVKNKHKIDRPFVSTGSAASLEHDHSMTMQSNSVAVDFKVGVVPSNSVERVDKSIEVQNRRSEPVSIENGNNISVSWNTWDAPAVDRGILQSTDDTTSRRVSHVKSQISKRSYRGSQEARASDNSQGSEGLVWAPVRAVNQQATANDKQKSDQIGAVQPSGSISSEVVVQHPIRNRRAELERYVPKPVAKEQAQHQENCQHRVAGSSGSSQDQTDRHNTQQGMVNNVVTGETWQQHPCIGENKGHIGGMKQGKPNVSWRQRNSIEICENKVSNAQPCVEVETASTLQTTEVTVSKTRQPHMEAQDFKAEAIKIHSQPHLPDIHKLEQLPKSVPVQSNTQQVSNSEADQSTQTLSVPHLHTTIVSKDLDSQPPLKREQNMHDRFYQANRSRQKAHKFSIRHAHMEGNHQFTKVGPSEESHSVEQSFSQQRPRSSGSWTPKQQVPTDLKEHNLHQKTTSVGQADVHQVIVDSHGEHHDFQKESVRQARFPSHQKTVAGQQEAPQSSAKQQYVQDRSFRQSSVSPHQFEGKKQGSDSVFRLQTNHSHQQQLKSSHSDRQAAEKEQPKQNVNSTTYQHRRQAGQGHWQQTGANARSNTRRTDNNEEQLRPAIVQNRKLQDFKIPRNPESSFECGGNHRQDTTKQHVLVNSDPIKQNLQVNSQPISNQKPQEFYQSKTGSASGNGDKLEINHGIVHHGGSPWVGEHRSNHAYHDRDNNHVRRGRSGGRGGRGFDMRGNETESKIERPSKQRLLVDATGGAVPHQVAG